MKDTRLEIRETSEWEILLNTLVLLLISMNSAHSSHCLFAYFWFMSSSLSSKVSLNATTHSLPSSSSSTCLVSKQRFIWRFPPLKFHHLPSCDSRQCSSIEMAPLNTGHELFQRQELSIFLCDLGLALNVWVHCCRRRRRESSSLSNHVDIRLDRLLAFTRVLFTCIDSSWSIHSNNVSKK